MIRKANKFLASNESSMHDVTEESKLAILFRVNKLINQERSLNKLLEATVTTLPELLGIEKIAIFLANEKRELRLVKEKGFGSVKAEEKALAEGALLSRQPIVLKGVESTRFDEKTKANKWKLFVPLRHKTKALGVMVLEDLKEGITFKEGDLDFIQMLANEVSASLENLLLIEEIMKKAIIDYLTQIYNRRYFMEKLEEEILRTKRFKHPLSLIILDIDLFKLYNDANGHVMGDWLLKNFAQVLLKNIRETDVVARYGGEEFIVLMPETTNAEALKLAEKLRKKTEEFPFERKEAMPSKSVTASFGVTTYWEGEIDSIKLIENADKALYLAKANGRNKVYNDPAITPFEAPKQPDPSSFV